MNYALVDAATGTCTWHESYRDARLALEEHPLEAWEIVHRGRVLDSSAPVNGYHALVDLRRSLRYAAIFSELDSIEVRHAMEVIAVWAHRRGVSSELAEMVERDEPDYFIEPSRATHLGEHR